jgi:hypothetical protein
MPSAASRNSNQSPTLQCVDDQSHVTRVDYTDVDRQYSLVSGESVTSSRLSTRRRRMSARRESDPTSGQHSVDGGNSASTRYKTELCRSYQETGGVCRYGDKCQFAHGVEELRSVDRHPRYKTELCRTFHSRGFCAYGPRCHFIHNGDDVNRSPTGQDQLIVDKDQVRQMLLIQQRLVLLSRQLSAIDHSTTNSTSTSSVRRPSAPVLGVSSPSTGDWLTEFRLRSTSLSASATPKSPSSESTPSLSPQSGLSYHGSPHQSVDLCSLGYNNSKDLWLTNCGNFGSVGLDLYGRSYGDGFESSAGGSPVTAW